MKRSFRIAKLLLACLVIRDFFISCNEENDFDGKHKNFTAGKPIKGKIHIINYSMADGSLILRDDDNQDAIYGQVTRNQKIKWVVDHDDDEPEMANFEIDRIYADPKFPNPADFFSERPKKNDDQWTATINGDNLDPTKGFLEKYIIAWKIKGNEKTYFADPIIQLNPK